MKILFEANHPAHVHFFKNTIRNLEDRGHEILIEARDKEVTLALLDAYKLNYKIVGPHYKGLVRKAYGLVKTDYKLLKIARDFKPDLLVGRGSAYLAHLSVLTNKSYIAFVDTEHANLVANLTLPFVDVICTPSCFKRGLNPKKHVQFDGYKELAYLHPNYFKPDPSVLDDLGLSRNDKSIVLRFVSWRASHDIGQHGISQKMRAEYLSKLEQYGEVFIISEEKLEKKFEGHKLKIAPEKFHSLLSYAQLYIGEGGSTATEAAILGTPTIHISSTAKFCGVFDDLHNNYNLIYTFSDDYQALEKAIDILEDPESKKKWAQRKDKMLRDKIDVTAFMTNFIENYPQSFYELKEKEQGE
jgi:predicted glycosyltransferase